MLRAVVRPLRIPIGVKYHKNGNAQLNSNRKRLDKIVLVIDWYQVASEASEFLPLVCEMQLRCDVGNVFESLHKDGHTSEEHLCDSRLKRLMNLRNSAFDSALWVFAHRVANPDAQVRESQGAHGCARVWIRPPDKSRVFKPVAADKQRRVGCNYDLIVGCCQLRKHIRKMTSLGRVLI